MMTINGVDVVAMTAISHDDWNQLIYTARGIDRDGREIEAFALGTADGVTIDTSQMVTVTSITLPACAVAQPRRPRIDYAGPSGRGRLNRAARRGHVAPTWKDVRR